MLTLADLRIENLILLEAVAGSHAYGLATHVSDTDIKGVFYLPRRFCTTTTASRATPSNRWTCTTRFA